MTIKCQCNVFAGTSQSYLEIKDKFHTNNFQFVNKVNQTNCKANKLVL